MIALDATLARAVGEITRELLPQGYDVSADAPGTLEACTEYFRKHGTVCVSDYFGPDCIMGRNVDQYAFQAWHDFCHVKLQASFDRPGERRVDKCMAAGLRAWRKRQVEPCTMAQFNRALAVIRANNVGRLDYWAIHNEPPANARLFTEGYLAALGIVEARS